MKRILAILLQLLCAAVAVAVLPTPVTLTVSVNTNGVVVAPTNFWAANSNLVNAVVSGGGGGGGGAGTTYAFATNAFVTSGTNVSLSTTLYSPLTISGSFAVTSSPSARFSGTNVWLEGRSSVRIYTPAMYSGTATDGQVLTLTDDANGTVEYATPSDATKLPLTGGTMSGPLNMGSQKIASLGSGTASTEAINLGQLDERITVDQARDNIVLNPASNFVVDTNAATREVTLLSASGALPSRVGTSTHSIAGFAASGAIMARRTYWVDGSSGQLTYNAVAYNPGDTFIGVYGVKTYSATGNCRAKDNVTRQSDSSYAAGTAYVASILGGYDQLNNQIAGTIAGGGHNVLRGGDGGNHSTVVGGSYNTQHSGVYAFIGGGTANENRADFGTIVGGWGNWITDDNWSAADQSVILNGQEGQIQDTAFGFIATGINNRVINPFSSSSAYHNQIINGNGNIVQTMAAGLNYSTVLNGAGNTISGGAHNLAMGLNNNIYGDSGGYNIALGNAVNIDGTGTYAFGYGATVLITNSPRAVVMGAATTVGGTSDSWTFANNSTVTNAAYAFTGGNSHALNGTQYTFLMGRALSSADLASPAVNADYGAAFGWQGVIRSYGQRVESNGNESTVNIQRSRYLLKRRSAMTTGVDVQLRLDGSTEFIYVPTNSVWTVRAAIAAAQSDGVKFGGWTLDFSVRDAGGVLSLLGSPASVVVHDGHSGTWTVTAGVRSDATYRGVVINARGLTGETVTWAASLDSTEVNGAW